MESFQKKGKRPKKPGDPGNPDVSFHGEERCATILMPQASKPERRSKRIVPGRWQLEGNRIVNRDENSRFLNTTTAYPKAPCAAAFSAPG